jgi:hypothetical protein
MKKTVLTTLVLTVFLVTTVLAQNNEKTFVSGIRGGFHAASLVMDGSKPNEASALNNFYIGFFNDNKLAPMFYFGKGLEYFQNGIAYTSNSERILHTVSVPLYLKLKLGPVFGLGGIAGNFKVSEKFSAGDYEVSPTDSDKSNWFDAPVFLGAGVKIFFVSVEARYHWGLIEVRNGLKSQYFQVGAAVSF